MKEITYYCHGCDCNRTIADVYLDKHLSDSQGNAIVYCDYCDSEVGKVILKK